MKAITPTKGNGPRKGWADWRKARDRAIIKPRKSVGARKMAKAEAKRSQSAKRAES